MIPKEKFFDSMGKPLTQALFIEYQYDPKYALYSLKDYDHTYEGVLYPSLKKLYLAEEDPTEYIFVSRHLGSWYQWKRMQQNKMVVSHINQWRDELELKLRSQAIRNMIDMSTSEDGNFSAAKYLAEYGWEKRKAGRPTKEEKERHLAVEQNIRSDFDADIKRLDDYRGKISGK